MEVKRTERGWAGHFCCSYRCEYHRNTLLEYNGLKVVVSTVGRLRKDMVSNTYEDLGYKRYFETMAFIAKEDDKYNDADVEREISFDAKWSLPSPYMELEAEAMHEDVVTELSKRLVDGTLLLKDAPSILSEIEGMTEETAQRLNKICGQFSETLDEYKSRKLTVADLKAKNADLKAKNRVLEQCLHQLEDYYNEVMRQLNGKEKRKEEDSSKPTLGEIQQMSDLFG